MTGCTGRAGLQTCSLIRHDLARPCGEGGTSLRGDSVTVTTAWLAGGGGGWRSDPTHFLLPDTYSVLSTCTIPSYNIHFFNKLHLTKIGYIINCIIQSV